MKTFEKQATCSDKFEGKVRLFQLLFGAVIATALVVWALSSSDTTADTALHLVSQHALPVSSRATTDTKITAATWNIRWFPAGFPGKGKDASEKKAVSAAASMICKAEPTFICLQEMRDRAVVDELVSATGLRDLKVAACSDFPVSENQPVGQQEAILTTFPVEEAGYERWHTSGYIDPPRGYAYAILETPSGPVAVYSVHFKSNYIAEEQNEARTTKLNRMKRELASRQIRAIADKWMKKNADRNPKVVIAGDFNTSLNEKRWEDESTIREFFSDGYTSCFEGMNPAAITTVPKSEYNSAVTFDYIMHKGFSKQESTKIYTKQWISDHRMVSVNLSLN